jgi:hypothetical protein
MKMIDILRMAIDAVKEEKHYVPYKVFNLSLGEFPEENITDEEFVPEEEINSGTTTVSKGTGSKSGRQLIQKVISPRDVKHDHTRAFRAAIMHPEAAREIFGGQVAKELELEHYPEYTVKSSVRHKDPMKHKIVMHSTYIPGQPLIEFDEMHGARDREEPISFALQRTLQKLDPDSVTHTAIFNYIINHGDQHAGNFMVTTDKKLVPIDYGRSVHPLDQEKQLFDPDHSHTLRKHYIDLKGKEKINPEILKRVANKKDRILALLDKIVLPHYPAHLRSHVRERMQNRLQAIASLSEHPSPNFAHLGAILKTKPNYDIDFVSPTKPAGPVNRPPVKQSEDLEVATKPANG